MAIEKELSTNLFNISYNKLDRYLEKMYPTSMDAQNLTLFMIITLSIYNSYSIKINIA